MTTIQFHNLLKNELADKNPLRFRNSHCLCELESSALENDIETNIKYFCSLKNP